MESQFRRRSMRSSFNSDARRTPRRFFGRSASSALRQSKSMPPDEQSPRRRSFLAKPPAPGAARRVLAVLNQSQKRAAATNRKPPSTQPVPLAGTGYEPIHDKHPKISLHHNKPHSPTTNSPTWQHDMSPSPLKKPIAPSRHVRPLDDLSDPVRTDSPASSLPYSRPPSRPLLHQQTLLEVDASEVSDELHSTTDPKSRSGRFSASTTRTPDRDSPSRTQDLVFIDDVQPPGVKFVTVGAEDADVPAAPTDAQNQFSNKLDLVQSWATYEGRVRVLQRELDEARDGRSAAERTNADLTLRNKELDVLVNSLRTRTAESSAEVEELTRHLKDTRKRLTRRIRELEDELASQKSHFHGSEGTAKYRERDDHARSEVSTMRPSLSRAGTAPSLPGRRRRTQALPSSMTFNNDVHTRPIADGFAQSAQNGHFARIRSTGNVHDISTRRKYRSESFSGVPRPGTPNRKPYRVSDEEEDASPRTIARRSLVRRALIAHIHSSRYRTAKHVWYEFLHAEAGNVTPDQFARAVRGLAVAADASDRDLDVLRQEVCGAQECDTGVLSWSMFLKFYQLTKDERT